MTGNGMGQTGQLRRVGWKPLSYQVQGQPEAIRELPFVVAVLADLSGESRESLPKLRDRRFVRLDVDNIDEVLRSAAPHVKFDVPNLLEPSAAPSTLHIDLSFTCIDDFHPDMVVNCVPQMVALLRIRTQLETLAQRLEVRPSLGAQLSKLMAQEHVQNALQADLALPAEGAANHVSTWLENSAALGDDLKLWPGANVRDLVYALQTCHLTGRENLIDAVQGKIDQLDQTLTRQLDVILHHPSFQQLEATWRGLAYLSRELETGSLLKLRVLNVTAKEAYREFAVAMQFDSSAFYRKLYEEEAGTFGGEPISLVLFDYALTSSDKDINLAEEMSHIGAKLSAPIVFGTSPSMFGLEAWDELPRPRSFTKIFETRELDRWRHLSASKDSNHLVMVLPPLLARLPWDMRASGDFQAPVHHAFAYAEGLDCRSDFLWMNGAYGLTALIAHAFARDRWCADLRGPIWGRIDGVAAHFVVQNSEIVEVVGPTAIDVTQHRHFELGMLGFTSITRHAAGEFVAMNGPTVFAKKMPSKLPNESGGGSHDSQLEHVLCVGRVQQTVRSFLRDNAGVWSNLDAAAIAVELWLMDYCTLDDGEPTPTQAMAPLAPFRSVRVRSSDAQSEWGGEGQSILVVELEMNYVPSASSICRFLFVAPPYGFLASRIVP